ncbi:MAG TPA: magnesium chelatase [bacterium]|nr:magnesium chelatase [bacterium]HOL93752.1 magnesium chelatase [bacterium]HXK94896.1 magnesium chelatase [bacterium]
MSRPKTLGELRAEKYQTRPVKEELRSNLVQKLKSKQCLFPGIIGYDHTVIPQIINAILSRHDMIFLGLRGQAKSRIIRQLPSLLDEYIPIVAGSEINDDPYHPISKYARDLIAQRGDETPIDWISAEERYKEKLATPDVTIADLIGDIDPIKAAKHRLDLSDEEAISFGLIPRSNRGIFAINELPDLSPKIQVGLFNIMQERDIQIRGYSIRLPLDVFLVYSANPQDYTNRGRIVTPLKDRIGSEIRTHYPLTREEGMAITDQEARINNRDGLEIIVPHFIKQIVEEIARAARENKDVEQSSGISARFSITCMENLVSSAERRALLNGERVICPRASDLIYMLPAMTGKMELSYSGEERGSEQVARRLIRQAVRVIFNEYFGHDDCQSTIDWFHEENRCFMLHDNMPATEIIALAEQVRGLTGRVKAYLKNDPLQRPEVLASGIEFMLEGLFAHKRLSKTEMHGQVRYG